jgi:hypothetical protein
VGSSTLKKRIERKITIINYKWGTLNRFPFVIFQNMNIKLLVNTDFLYKGIIIKDVLEDEKHYIGYHNGFKVGIPKHLCEISTMIPIEDITQEEAHYVLDSINFSFNVGGRMERECAISFFKEVRENWSGKRWNISPDTSMDLIQWAINKNYDI